MSPEEARKTLSSPRAHTVEVVPAILVCLSKARRELESARLLESVAWSVLAERGILALCRNAAQDGIHSRGIGEELQRQLWDRVWDRIMVDDRPVPIDRILLDGRNPLSTGRKDDADAQDLNPWMKSFTRPSPLEPESLLFAVLTH